MLKKVIAGAVLIGLVSVLTVGAITRTAAKTGQVASVSAQGRGQESAEHAGEQALGQSRGQGRGQGAGEQALEQGQDHGHDEQSGEQGLGQEQGRGQGQGQGRGQGQGQGRGQGTGNAQSSLDGDGKGSGSAERQYPNFAEAPHDWVVQKGVVAQAPQEGVDLIVATAEGDEIQVGTGPNYLASQGYVLQAGDEVQIEGYWEDGELKAAVLTRLHDGESITLRDELGRPAWAGSGRRAQASAETGTDH